MKLIEKPMKNLIHQMDIAKLQLSANQKRLWIVSQQARENPAYNLVLAYHIKGGLNLEFFRKSLEILFNHQYTIFSVFRQNEGLPYIEIIPRAITLDLIDFSNEPKDSRKGKILSFAGEVSRKSFDLEKGPLYRLLVLKEDDSNYYFQAVIHHLIFDAGSISIFANQLSRIYTSLCRGWALRDQPIVYQSLDFSTFEVDNQVVNDEKEFVKYWKERLRGCPTELKFPYDLPRKNSTTGLGLRESLIISKQATSKLKRLSNAENSTLFKTILSLLGVLIQKYSGEQDFCIGIPVSNRRAHSSRENIFGLFVDTSVVRFKTDEDISFREHLCYTRDEANRAIKNSKLTFDKIVEAVNPERISNINPLFQIVLSWWNNVTIPLNLDGIEGERINIPGGISPFDLTFYMWEDGDIIRGEIEYNIDILEHDSVVRLKKNFIGLIESVTDSPDQKLSEISIISESDNRKLNCFNNTEAEIPDCLVQSLFERQAVDHPFKTAVNSETSSLTYQQLDSKSNQLAQFLISNGLAKGDIVGISLERSVEMVISVLGILKAGGCYLPLDPSFPDDRINYMIEDSGTTVIITQSSLKVKYSKLPRTSIILIDTEWNRINLNENTKPDLSADTQSGVYMIYTSGST